MFVSQMAFFARISDPALGGTYMTLLNLGSCDKTWGIRCWFLELWFMIFWFTFLLFKQRQVLKHHRGDFIVIAMVHLFISFRIEKNMLGTWGRLRFKILLKKPPFPTSREKTGNRPQLSGFSEFPKAQVRMLVKPLTLRQTNTAGWKIHIFPDKYHQNGGIFHGYISLPERTVFV